MVTGNPVFFVVNFLNHNLLSNVFAENVKSHNKINIFTNMRQAKHDKLIT